jgi:hypothetical protein
MLKNQRFAIFLVIIALILVFFLPFESNAESCSIKITSPSTGAVVYTNTISYAQLYQGIKLRINDMSLPWGGLFDIGNNWSNVPGHNTHRIGRNADIGFNGIDGNGRCAGLNLQKLRNAISQATGRWPHLHSDHYHITVNP